MREGEFPAMSNGVLAFTASAAPITPPSSAPGTVGSGWRGWEVQWYAHCSDRRITQ
ncbi:hypothetical protein [Azospirillum endophyticum]